MRTKTRTKKLKSLVLLSGMAAQFAVWTAHALADEKMGENKSGTCAAVADSSIRTPKENNSDRLKTGSDHKTDTSAVQASAAK
jgi:hypothetical protein